MVFNVLVAAKSVLLGPRWRTAGNEVRGLIVAEARKGGVLTGEVVIETNVPSAFVEPPHRLINVVVACGVRIGRRIKLNHLCGDRINQRGGNYLARSKARAWRLASGAGRRLGKTGRNTALKRPCDGSIAGRRTEFIWERIRN